MDCKALMNFLDVLNYTSNETVYFRAFKKGSSAQKAKGTIESLPAEWLQQCEGRLGIGIVVNGGGEKNEDITTCRALFYEHDDLPVEESRVLWQTLGLPVPTLQVETGNKSVHSYWVLTEQIPADEWRELQTDLLAYANGDKSLCNPNRVMRVPGFVHPETGRIAECSITGERVAYTVLRAAVPRRKDEADSFERLVANRQPAARSSSVDDVERARYLLSFIPPRRPGTGTYEESFKVLAALIHHFGETQGLALAREWSPDQDWGQDLLIKARGILNGGGSKPAGYGSLDWIAREHGYKPTKPRAIETPVNVQSSDDEPTIYDSLNGWLFVADANAYCHQKYPSDYNDKTAIDKALSRFAISDKKKRIKPSDQITQVVKAVRWYPGKAKIFRDQGDYYLNAHKPYHRGKPGDVSPWLNLLKGQFDDYEVQVIEWYLAHTLQKPEVKINWALFLSSKHEGTGKDSALAPFGDIMGDEFNASVKPDDLFNGFNPWLAGKKLIVIQETKDTNDSRSHLKEQMKNLIAAPPYDVEINLKHQKQYKQPNLCSVVVLSNYPDSLDMEGSRRFFGVYTTRPPQGDYAAYYRWLENGGWQAIAHHLMTLDLSGFDAKTLPKLSDSYAQIAELSRTDTQLSLLDIIDDHGVVDLSWAARELGVKAKRLIYEAEGLKLYVQTRDERLQIKINGKPKRFRLIYDPKQLSDGDAKEKFRMDFASSPLDFI